MLSPTDQPNAMVPRRYSVRRKTVETRDTFTLELQPRDGNGPVTFRPGQFNMVYVFGVGEVALSVSGDPANVKTVTHTVRVAGSVTSAMRGLAKGAMVGLRGPFGCPWPIDQAVGRDVVVVAGGIGFAPLRPVLCEIASRRTEFGSVVLLYGARSPEDILFRRELQLWRELSNVDVLVTVDRAAGVWSGRVGVVTSLISRASFDPATAVAFMCGPEIMMRFTAGALRQRGMSPEQVFVSLERNMKCGIGFCGHCQLGPAFICKDGPVLAYHRVKRLLEMREI